MAPKALLQEIDRKEFYDFMSKVLDAYVKLNGDRKTPFDRIYPELERADSNRTVIPLVVKGRFYISLAWDARGIGLADTVSEKGWKTMAECLPEARKALTSAWAKDPMDPHVCPEMINVVLGECGPRREMELWFERGKAATPGSYWLYCCKLNYLKPQWHGSREEMHQFGLECVKEGRWVDHLPFMLITVHEELAKDLVSKADYFKKPGVWEEIKPIYEEYLSRFPKNNAKRSSYAYYAALSGQWEEARKQMDLVGNLVVPTAFSNLGTYFTIIDQIEQHSKGTVLASKQRPVVFQ